MVMITNQNYYRSRQILKALKNVCLESKDKLYLANSRDLINLIVELNLTEFWPTLKFDKQLLKYHKDFANNNNLQLQNEIEKDQQLEKLIQVQNIIKRYVNGTTGPDEENKAQSNSLRFKQISAVSIDDQGNEITLCAKDIIL